MGARVESRAKCVRPVHAELGGGRGCTHSEVRSGCEVVGGVDADATGSGGGDEKEQKSKRSASRWTHEAMYGNAAMKAMEEMDNMRAIPEPRQGDPVAENVMFLIANMFVSIFPMSRRALARGGLLCVVRSLCFCFFGGSRRVGVPSLSRRVTWCAQAGRGLLPVGRQILRLVPDGTGAVWGESYATRTFPVLLPGSHVAR